MLLAEQEIDLLPLEGGSISYEPHFLSEPIASSYLSRFLGNDISWRQEDILIYGKRHPQPRLIAWYGDPGRTYTYSRLRLTPNEWTPLLLEIKQLVEKAAASPFNSVLLNLYRSGQDSISWHADNEPELGETPTIGSVSLGATRRFRFKNRTTKEVREISLLHGSLLTMRGALQKFWVHDIPKEKGVVQPRVNLTFRQIH